MVAAEQELTVARQEILTAQIDEEAVAKAVRCYLILYVKSMKEFKEQKKKEATLLQLQSPAPFFI